MQSVPITTNVTSSNLAQAIQHYVIPLRITELNIVELDIHFVYGNYRDRSLHNKKKYVYFIWYTDTLILKMN
jgi:hypothetical protein